MNNCSNGEADCWRFLQAEEKSGPVAGSTTSVLKGADRHTTGTLVNSE